MSLHNEQIKLLTYNKRYWLNGEDSSFTGSLVCYLSVEDGVDDYPFIDIDGFIEFADCQQKVRLHSDHSADKNDPLGKYYYKVKKLYNSLGKYLDFMDDHRDELCARQQFLTEQQRKKKENDEKQKLLEESATATD